jgi:hypothetical protein
MSGPTTNVPLPAEAQKPKHLLRLLLPVLLGGVIILCGTWSLHRYAEYCENRRHPVSREEIESRVAIKAHPVLAMNGTVNGHSFELVMRGFTNYFLKETWGAARGERGLFGGQKPGGYSILLRTRQFSGQWQSGWQGSKGGGGGGAFDEYQDDLLPGRWLWNQKGFVGAKSDYEYHHTSHSYDTSFQQWEEEYRGCKRLEGTLIPTRISWRTGGRSSGQEWRKDCVADVVYKIRSFQFQDAPSETWFSDQVKKYFPDSMHSKITNSPSQ